MVSTWPEKKKHTQKNHVCIKERGNNFQLALGFVRGVPSFGVQFLFLFFVIFFFSAVLKSQFFFKGEQEGTAGFPEIIGKVNDHWIGLLTGRRFVWLRGEGKGEEGGGVSLFSVVLSGCQLAPGRYVGAREEFGIFYDICI